MNLRSAPRLVPRPDEYSPYTTRQGQFLAFIHHYRLVHGCVPAEADMQRFFQITSPSVHSMVLTLERRGLITRVPGQPRSIALLVSVETLPRRLNHPHLLKAINAADRHLVGLAAAAKLRETPAKGPEMKRKAYDQFHLIPETFFDGWTFGAITVYDNEPGGCRSGDGFVEAPDGSRAGLDWIVGRNPGRVRRVAGPSRNTWGVYEATFAKPVFTTADLAAEFARVLPALVAAYLEEMPPQRPTPNPGAYPRLEYGRPVVPGSHTFSGTMHEGLPPAESIKTLESKLATRSMHRKTGVADAASPGLFPPWPSPKTKSRRTPSPSNASSGPSAGHRCICAR